jgi:hypothetical protein
MQTKLGGIAAFCVGATLIVSCGGGGADGSIDDTGSPGVGGAKSAGGAPANASGAAASPSAGGAAGTTSSATGTIPGADVTNTGAAGAAADSAGTTPSAAGTTAGTTPSTAGTTAATTPGAAGTTPGAATPTAKPAGSAGATIVPLYTYPTDASWNTVIAAKAAHPTVGVVAAVNPANGPGAAADPGYAAGIARLNAAGIKVIGYVATGYAVKNAPVVKADIDRWRTFYPGQIGGIFFDEQSSRAGDVAYYRDLSQYAKAQGMSFTVGNPGTDTSEAFVGALDAMLIYESSGLPSATQMGGWHAKYPPSNFGVIPHTSAFDASFVRNARQYVQYIYVQTDTLPNPWDSVPGTFGDLLAALE